MAKPVMSKEHKLVTMAGALLVVIVLALAWYFTAAKPRTNQAIRNAIMGNLRIIESAKDSWSWDQKQQPGAIARESDLAPYLKNRQLPPPVAGERYELNPVGTPASAVGPGGERILIP